MREPRHLRRSAVQRGFSRAKGEGLANDPTRRWTIQDATDTYGVSHWGKGYFEIAPDGHLHVHPDKDPARSFDLKRLIDRLSASGFSPPILLRFSDILKHRIGEIAAAFRQAMDENGYEGSYRCVYPIKVNQQRRVVEEICEFGEPFGFGLEVGSRPELLAALALTADRELPVVCNGFKDDDYIQMVILAQKIGQQVIPVVEKRSELSLIIRHAEEHGVKPALGVRVKLAARGAGRWELSGGMRSKFGLFVPEVIEAHEHLKKHGMGDCLKLLHFHLGSQITNIRNLKSAITEQARVYVELKKAGAGLEYIDIGGGLGVDYDGSQTNFDSSMNYTLTEYASDAVYRIMSVCDEAGVPHPTIISESGRALVAYHSALIFDVLGVSRFDNFDAPKELTVSDGEEEPPKPLTDLFERLRDIDRKNCIEYYHDAVQSFEEALNSFNLGYIDLEQRAAAERLFWAVLGRVLKLTRAMPRVPEEVEGLPEFLADTYFCNLSIFQSMPDSWAINQIFPVMPIHELNRAPTRRGVLADVTCDSDGKIDRFTHLREDKRALELHEFTGEPYYIGAFLVGAYQEILGDLHNLFGDTHAVHVSLGPDGRAKVQHMLEGDTAREVLGYVQYSVDELVERMRRLVVRAVEEDRLTPRESSKLLRTYESGLAGYTYLSDSV